MSTINRGRFEKAGDFFKVEDGVAYGWAIVCTEDGKPYWDLQNDHIPEDEMVAAAIDFMKSSRVGSDQHTGERHGDIVFAFPVTKASSSLGLTANKTGLLIGYQPQDRAMLDQIAAGERTGFSIGGYLIDYDVSEVGKSIRLHASKSKHGAVPLAKDGQPDANDVYVPGEVGSKTNKPKKKNGKVYRRFKIDEISLVTKPAQEGATVAYVKGQVLVAIDQPDNVFTSSDDGHQHVIDTDDLTPEGMGYTWAAISADGTWHSHPLMRKDDGSIEIADNAGHGHSTDAKATNVTDEEVEDKGQVNGDGAAAAPATVVATIAMAAPTTKLTSADATDSVASKSMPTPEKTTMTEAEIAALNKRLARAEKMAELTDAQKGYAKSLGETELEAYLAKGATERAAIAKAAVAYTADDGTVFYNHDDQRTVAMAKQLDGANKALVMEKQLRLDAQYAKAAAEDLDCYEGDDATHVAVIAAVEGIKDEKVREAARKMLKAGNAAFAKAQKMSGSAGQINKQAGSSAGTELAKAEAELKKSVETYQGVKKLATYAEAFTAAIAEDQASRDAYDRVSDLRRAAN